MQNDTFEQNEPSKLEQKAQSIFERIVSTYNQQPLISVEKKPLADFNPAELTELVEKEFNQYGLNYILLGKFDRHGSTTIKLPVEKNSPFQNIDEVKEILNSQVEIEIRNLQKTCQKCKAIIYDHLLEYQDKENRKKQRNPFHKFYN